MDSKCLSKNCNSPHYVPQLVHFQIFAYIRALVCLYTFCFIIWIWIATFSALWKRMSGLEVWEQQVPVWLIWPALAGKRNLGEWGLHFLPNASEGFAFFNAIWLMDKLILIWYLQECNQCITKNILSFSYFVGPTQNPAIKT